MKFSIIINRFVALVVLIFALGLSSLSQAQNTTVEMQTNKQEGPSFKIQVVESTDGNKKSAHNYEVKVMTIEKSDKMVIITEKDMQSNSKTAPANKTAVIRKEKSEKIDQ